MQIGSFVAANREKVTMMHFLYAALDFRAPP
jgi:hypothetical protein